MLLTVTVITVLVASFYLYRRFYCHSYFKKLGIPGPEPHFLFGNMLDLWKDDMHLVIHEWAKKYGDVFGYFEGSRPVLVFSSIAGAESICIKQCGVFAGRMASLIQPDSEKEPDHPLLNLLLAKGERWRKPRMTANRFFSAPKMRAVLPFFEKRIPLLLAIIKRSNGRPLDVADPFERYAMDSLAEAGFSLHMKLLEPVDDSGKLPQNRVFLQSVLMMHNFLAVTPFVFKFISSLPEVIPAMKFIIHLVMKYAAGPLSPFLCMFAMMAKAIEDRRSEDIHQTNGLLHPVAKAPPDLIRLFMNVTKFDDAKTLLNNGSLKDNSTPKDESNGDMQEQRYMSEQEMKAQLVTLFLSGYETTSISLTFLAAVLATNQDVQEKLLREIAETFPDSEVPIDYDKLMSMEYMECVCQELLRLYPVAVNAVNRLVTEDASVCTFPVTKKVAKVLINVWSIHMDPEQWGAEPERFWPERFLPENIPSTQSRSAFLGFGIGPHQCVGKMFSQVEIKYVMVHLLRRYKLTWPSKDVPQTIPVKVAIVMTPREPVRVNFVPRKTDCGEI